MKLRIKGNTLRLRLTKSELEFFEKSNFIEEKTAFGSSIFSYSLCAENIDTLTATLENNKIIVHMPFPMAKEWTETQKVGFKSEMEIGDTKKLFILVEKDFKCLDETIEDQSDNYENPLASSHP
jgi:hypothetical protein